ncbi:hypothetical protein ACHAWF_006874 [Thalassiosira exigua]
MARLDFTWTARGILSDIFSNCSIKIPNLDDAEVAQAFCDIIDRLQVPLIVIYSGDRESMYNAEGVQHLSSPSTRIVHVLPVTASRMTQRLEAIANREGWDPVPQKVLEDVSRSSGGNLRLAIDQLQLEWLKRAEDGGEESNAPCRAASSTPNKHEKDERDEKKKAWWHFRKNTQTPIEQESGGHSSKKQAPWWQQCRCRRTSRCTTGLCLLVGAVAIVAIVVGVVKSRPDAGSSETSSSSNQISIGAADQTCEYRKTQEFRLDTYDIEAKSQMWGSTSDFDGDAAVVASYDEEGVGGVWALSRDASGSWDHTVFRADDEASQFGWDVAVGGDTIVVGAPAKNRQFNAASRRFGGFGAAAVFSTSGNGGWYQGATFMPKDLDTGAAFGVSVDVADCGCLIAVGAWNDREGRGSAYLFSKTEDGSWTEYQKLAPSSSRQSESIHHHGNFGTSVALHGSMLAVKAPFDYLNGIRGVTYVYRRQNDNYEEMARLPTPEGPQASATSGSGMIFMDDFLFVGSAGNKKVYVFEQTSRGGFDMMAKLTASDASQVSDFGTSIDGEGGQVLVRDCGDDKSYLFALEDGEWKEKATLHGCNASISGNSILLQSPQDFVTNELSYGGPMSSYDLHCELPVNLNK